MPAFNVSGRSERLMFHPLTEWLLSRGWHSYSKWNFSRTPLWLGMGDGRRRLGTILLAPTQDQLISTEKTSPGRPIWVAEALKGNASQVIPDVKCLPRLVPKSFFPPGEGADVFGVTERLHLHERPRVVAFGPFTSGADLTLLLELAHHFLSAQGELILYDAVAIRQNLAPVVKRRRLEGSVIFAPQLDASELAGMLHGVDLVIQMAHAPDYGYEITLALAAGCPIVARHGDVPEALLGTAALYTFEDTVEAWKGAVKIALEQEEVREHLIAHAMTLSAPWRETEALPLWQEALSELADK